jgi:UDP-N-acetylmuramoyl-L-alanyl-D-glutamate--2,6-diaminopimelate ligase
MARMERPTSTPVRLAELIEGMQWAGQPASPDLMITGVTLNSREVRAGDLFAALPGHVRHGADFAAGAVAAGAVAILTDAAGLEQCAELGVPVAVIDNPRARLGDLAANAHGRPADSLTMIGVTGTNGKTTVTHLLDAALVSAGHRTGVIGTVGVSIAGERHSGSRTTPESTELHELLAVMRATDIDAVSMEVSSHAMSEHRVDGVLFDVVGFTNLTQDHLDYHGTMEAYFLAKAELFTPAHARRAVIGVDDEWGARLAATCPIEHVTWSAEGNAADWAVSASPSGITITGPGETCEIDFRLPGAFNRANAVCAFAMLRGIGVPAADIARSWAEVAVPGRMEDVSAGHGFRVLVDYAHTPDAVERALTAARDSVSAGSRLIAVIGAGGDRDRGKRPEMGALAARLADAVWITDDNPRSEDPAAIRAAVREGVMTVPGDLRAEVRETGDRALAIHEAISTAMPGDVVAILGKGHESGQDVAGVITDFDDRVVARAALAAAHGAGA